MWNFRYLIIQRRILHADNADEGHVFAKDAREKREGVARRKGIGGSEDDVEGGGDDNLTRARF